MSIEIDGIRYLKESINNARVSACVNNNIAIANIQASVTFPGDNFATPVTIIDNSVFTNLTSLTTMNVPNGVTTIGVQFCIFCTSLTEVNLPNSLLTIGHSAFYACTSLTSITIPIGLSQLSTNFLRGCTALTSITIPSNINIIDEYVLSQCTSLTSINMNNGITQIGNSCFTSCTGLTSINIPTSITNIPFEFCIYCSALNNLVIPNNITNISQYAFYGCTSLFNVSIDKQSTCLVNTTAFTNVSSNLSSNITFYNTTNVSQLTSNWATIKNKYRNVTYNPNNYLYPPSITDFFIPTKTYGDPSFTITQPQSTSSGSFSYTSSNLSVATVSGFTITIVGAGSSIITATQAATAYYSEGTITTPFQVNQATPTITNFSIPTKTYGDTPFTIIPPTSTSSGSFTYSSSNESVATVSDNTITIVGAGTSIITATQAETTNYTSGTITTPLQVTQAIPIITNFSIPTKTYGDTPFTITEPQSTSSGSFSYTSSNESVATILGNIITIVGVGSSTITATQAETTNYTSGAITAPFQVTQAIPIITNFSIPTKTYGDTPFTITEPQSTSSGSFSYTSSNESVATILGNIITIVGVGSSTITATQVATTDYSEGTITAPLQVTKATPIITNFYIPIKINGDSPFTITQPTSTSSGSFSYASSNVSVATVSGSTITIVGAGYTIITATQLATENYEAGIIETTFNVAYVITNVDELEYFLQTDATYCNITESLVISSDLTAYSSKVITSDENVKITKSLIG